MAILKISGFIINRDAKNPFELSISEPENRSDGDDVFCRIQCSELFKGEKRIFGVDGEQAGELALNFVRTLLSNRQVIDQNGQTIKL